MKKKLVSINSILNKFLKKSAYGKTIKQTQAIYNWEKIVGEQIALNTKPLLVRDDKLYVEVKGSVWLQELNFYKADILFKINKHLGEKLIKDIIFSLEK